MSRPSQPVVVHDLLGHVAPEAERLTTQIPLQSAVRSRWFLVSVTPGETWRADAGDEERSLLLLEGRGTVVVGDWRQTLGSGHLVVVEPGASLEVIADGQRSVVALLSAAGPAPTPERT